MRLEDKYRSKVPELIWHTSLDDFAAIAMLAMAPKEIPVVGLDHLHAPLVSIREQAAEVVTKLRAGKPLTFRELIADAAVAGDSGTALALLRHLITSGQDPVAIIGGIAMKTRNMAKLYQNRQVTAAQLGVAPWVIDKTRRDLTGWTDEGLANVVLEMAVADAAAKGAEKDAVYALERLVLLIAHKGLQVAGK